MILGSELRDEIKEAHEIMSDPTDLAPVHVECPFDFSSLTAAVVLPAPLREYVSRDETVTVRNDDAGVVLTDSFGHTNPIDDEFFAKVGFVPLKIAGIVTAVDEKWIEVLISLKGRVVYPYKFAIDVDFSKLSYLRLFWPAEFREHVDAECPECWGTGYFHAWGADCKRGCKAP